MAAKTKSVLKSNPSIIDVTAPGPYATLFGILTFPVLTPTGHRAKVVGDVEAQQPEPSETAFPATVTVPRSAVLEA